ncbi:MAG: sulfite exporter TauE/SafE family protein [Ruminococcaceae bacterium]|nr:sulfite exporter TauE/SafE family protein [Oscillospiraceae bacterium]
MMNITSVIAGAVTGVLSGFGIGGGTLLMIWMTQFANISQTIAQGINLLYFIPTSTASLIAHFKNKFIDLRTAIPAAAGGVITTTAASWFATSLDVSLMKKIFGGFLIAVGVYELFRKVH